MISPGRAKCFSDATLSEWRKDAHGKGIFSKQAFNSGFSSQFITHEFLFLGF
jgi:hypothetical protein